MDRSEYDEIDLAYAAGFLDGEGSFWSYGTAKIGVTCSNTYKPIIDWLHENFGGSVTKPSNPRKDNHRPVYSWQVTDTKAAKLCQAIAPYLREKTEQALLLIAINQTASIPKVKRKIRPDVVAERIRLSSILKGKKHVSW